MPETCVIRRSISLVSGGEALRTFSTNSCCVRSDARAPKASSIISVDSLFLNNLRLKNQFKYIFTYKYEITRWLYCKKKIVGTGTGIPVITL
jgi:hypothetical protein